MAAEQFTLAHGIVVIELAPEAVLRNDMNLLRKLFEPFRGQAVSGWEAGGEVRFLDSIALSKTKIRFLS